MFGWIKYIFKPRKKEEIHILKDPSEEAIEKIVDAYFKEQEEP